MCTVDYMASSFETFGGIATKIEKKRERLRVQIALSIGKIAEMSISRVKAMAEAHLCSLSSMSDYWL